MATKEKAAKRKGPGNLDVGSDPPILVGGGGSSLIWVNFAEGQTPVKPKGLPANAPTPMTKDDYSLSKIMSQPARLYFNDGTTMGPLGEKPLDIANQKTWYIRFAKPGESRGGKKARKK